MSTAPLRMRRTNAKVIIRPVQASLVRSPEADGLLAIPDASRQLQALVLQNDELLRTHSILIERVSVLELALANANQFANYDELTGLPNRRLLLDRFNHGVTLADRQGRGVALLFFDLNEFKGVNDTLGHEAGDKLLQQVAIRLTKSIRTADTACRYGGDEFVILLTDIDHRRDAAKALRKIQADLVPPYVFEGYSFPVTISDGMAIYPQDAKTFAELMRMSDTLMLDKKFGGTRQRIQC